VIDIKNVLIRKRSKKREAKVHEVHPIEKAMMLAAQEISTAYKDAPVIIIIGGSTEAGVPRCMTASSLQGKEDRLRDFIGILQTAQQIETLKHFGYFKKSKFTLIKMKLRNYIGKKLKKRSFQSDGS